MTITKLGSYVAGEIPEPWVHTFEDANGTVLNLTGYTVKVTYKLDGGTQVVRSGALVGPGTAGQGTYVWVAGDFTTAGTMRGEMTVGNGANRYAQSFVLVVSDPQGGALPAI